MVLIALLLVALVCLALGLLLASAVWLIGSLAASAVAAILLWRVRGQLVAPAHTGPAAEDSESPEQGEVWVIDGRPRYHRADCARIVDQDAERIPYRQAVEDGFVACGSCLPAEATPAAAQAPAKQAPASQAPIERAPTKRAPTRQGQPVHAAAAQSAAAASGEPAAEQVWVIDGRPRYHRADCLIIEDQPAEPIPFEQATGDGFMPCSLCEPDRR